jgi:hypothetical protein
VGVTQKSAISFSAMRYIKAVACTSAGVKRWALYPPHITPPGVTPPRHARRTRLTSDTHSSSATASSSSSCDDDGGNGDGDDTWGWVNSKSSGSRGKTGWEQAARKKSKSRGGCRRQEGPQQQEQRDAWEYVDNAAMGAVRSVNSETEEGSSESEWTEVCSGDVQSHKRSSSSTRSRSYDGSESEEGSDSDSEEDEDHDLSSLQVREDVSEEAGAAHCEFEGQFYRLQEHMSN